MNWTACGAPGPRTLRNATMDFDVQPSMLMWTNTKHQHLQRCQGAADLRRQTAFAPFKGSEDGAGRAAIRPRLTAEEEEDKTTGSWAVLKFHSLVPAASEHRSDRRSTAALSRTQQQRRRRAGIIMRKDGVPRLPWAPDPLSWETFTTRRKDPTGPTF